MKHITQIICFIFAFTSFVNGEKCIYSDTYKSLYCVNISSYDEMEIREENLYFYLIIENSTIDASNLGKWMQKFYHITLWNSNTTCSEINSFRVVSNNCFMPVTSLMHPQLPEYNLSLHDSLSTYFTLYIAVICAAVLNAISWSITIHLKRKMKEYGYSERELNSLR